MAFKRKPEEAPARPVNPCARLSCSKDATIRILVDGVLADYCYEHYMEHHTDQARASCAEKGLDTPQKQREAAMKALRGVLRYNKIA